MNHHPEPMLLEQYAAGTLTLSFAMCVSVHLNFCARCRIELQTLQNLGGQLFEELAPVPVDESLLQAVWNKIDNAAGAENVNSRETSAAAHAVPKSLRHLIPAGYDALHWTTMLPWVHVANLAGDDDGKHYLAVHRIRAGSKLPRHDHRSQEITLVLNGSFSDEYGIYGDGDFILRGPSQVHSPLIAQNEDCICLTAQSAPLRFTQPVWRLLSPFLT